MTIKFEIDKNLFKVGDNYICVNDEEIKKGDWYWTPIKRSIEQCVKKVLIIKNGENDVEQHKILFSTQPIHKSIPVLDIESESEEDNLAQSYFDDNIFCDTITKFEEYIALRCYGAGYQKAKEIFKYTEEDIRKAYNEGYYSKGTDSPISDDSLYIQSLQQPKEIESIEIECESYTKEHIPYETNPNLANPYDYEKGYEVANCKPIILPNGKIKYKVNYD